MAELTDLLERLAGPETGIDPAVIRTRVGDRRRRRRRSRVAVVGAAVAVAAAVLIVVSVNRDDTVGVDTAGTSTTAPIGDGKLNRVLLATNTGLAELDPTTGATTNLDNGLGSEWCRTCAIARVGEGVVVVDGHRAVWLPTTEARVANEATGCSRCIGYADAVYEAREPGSVWLSGGNSLNRIDAATGRPVESVTLPPGTAPAPQNSATGLPLPEGVVLRGSTDPNQPAQLTVYNPADNVITWKTGDNAEFVAARATPEGSLVAWVRSDCNRTGTTAPEPCSLHISNISRGTDTVIAPPANAPAGFIGGGQIEPDGRSVAAFVFTSPIGFTEPTADLAIVDIQARAAKVIAKSRITIAGLHVNSTSGADGTIYYTANADHAKSYRPGTDAALELLGVVTSPFTILTSNTTTSATGSSVATSTPADSGGISSTAPTPTVVHYETPRVPAGWQTVDVGDARISIPGDWQVRVVSGGTTCSPSDSAKRTLVVGAGAYNEGPSCTAVPPTPILRVSQANPPCDGCEHRTVNGLDMLRAPAGACATCSTMIVPELDTMLQTNGVPDLESILSTITVSPRYLAIRSGPLLDTSTWKTIDGGPEAPVSYRVPQDWNIVDLTNERFRIPPFKCSIDFSEPNTAIVGDNHFDPSCPHGGQERLPVGVDAIWARDPGNDIRLSTQRRTSIPGSNYDIVDFAAPEIPVITIAVQTREGVRLVSVGVGADPTIARTILTTIQPHQ